MTTPLRLKPPAEIGLFLQPRTYAHITQVHHTKNAPPYNLVLSCQPPSPPLLSATIDTTQSGTKPFDAMDVQTLASAMRCLTR